MKLKRIFKGFKTYCFLIGVNVIGIPDFHTHTAVVNQVKQVKR